MNAVVFAFPGNEALAARIAAGGDIAMGRMSCGRFPDGESHVHLESEVADADVVLICSLDRPDDKLLQLAFAASAARDMGARRVGVVAPYLAYLRQDRRFHDGDALTSACFAKLLSGMADWLLCVDPHLHRYRSLREIYSIPTTVLHAAPAVAQWVKDSVSDAVIIGPDDESEQWVAEVARRADAPYDMLHKERLGDREVKVSLMHAGRWRDRTPVLLDDIISSGGTMMAAVDMLKSAGLRAPLCVGVHAVFAEGAYARLQTCGAADVVTCNTLAHKSNAIDVHPLIVEGVRGMLR